MFELTLDHHNSVSPRTYKFDSHVDLALFLERIPTTVGFAGTQGITIEIKAMPLPTDTLFDILAEQDTRKVSTT